MKDSGFKSFDDFIEDFKRSYREKPSKPRKVAYAVPVGGLSLDQNGKLPGFDPEKHLIPSDRDFFDPETYIIFRINLLKDEMASLKDERIKLVSMFPTVEERRANREAIDLLKQVEKQIAKDESFSIRLLKLICFGRSD